MVVGRWKTARGCWCCGWGWLRVVSLPSVRDGLPAGAGSTNPGTGYCADLGAARFKCGEYGGAHVERHAEFERKFTMRMARPDVGYAPRTEQSRPGQVLPGPPPDHLSPPERNHQARTNQAPPPTTHKKSNPSPGKPTLAPATTRLPDHPKHTRKPFANPSDPNQNHPSIAPQRPAKKGRRAGRPPLTQNLGGGGGWRPTPLAAQTDARRRKWRGDQNDHA